MDDFIIKILDNHKKFLASGKLLDVKERKRAIKNLKKNIDLMKNEIFQALKLDLNKSEEESYMTEVGIVYCEISHILKKLNKYTKTKKVHTPLSNFPAKSYIKPCPYGSVLVISPWNYPFMLSIDPIIDAIAAGNSVVLKPSEYSPNTSAVLQKLISNTFESGFVDVINGDKEVCTQLLNHNFDYIFYTGSTRVGKIVMQKAAEHFTPVTLEMGGKSPCIVDKTANLKLTAKRIVFGKLLNAGQTCVAPDYLYCDETIKDKLIYEIEREIVNQYGIDPIKNANYPKMINKKQFDSMKSFITKDNLVFGGKVDENLLKIEPTILTATFKDNVMQEEVFGPILPVLTFKTVDEAIKNINSLTKPLAFYLFSNSKYNIKHFEEHCDFGGGCINDTIMHIANSNLPFGGIKESGIGCYHGKKGFETFTHYKSIVKKSNWLDMPLRYQPIGKIKYWFIKKFLK